MTIQEPIFGLISVVAVELFSVSIN